MRNWKKCKDCGEVLFFKIDGVTDERIPITCECNEEADEVNLRLFDDEEPKSK